MKFSTALTSLILVIPLFSGEVLGAAAIGRANGGKGGNKAGAGAGAGKQGAGAGKGAAQNSSAAAGAATANNTAAANSTATAAANNTVLASSGAANNTGAANNNNGNPQDSLSTYCPVLLAVFLIFIVHFPHRLALDPNVIAKGFELNGQQNATAGQVASLTSSNNFINFCLTVPNLPLTNGQQIKTGSCNPAPMGIIAATTNMPSAKFTNPKNGDNLQPNTAFTIDMAINNLETGNFVNADSNYYAAPQQVNSAGDIIGHTHFTVTAISSFTDTVPKDPNTFAFFKGVNGAAVNGVVSEPVTAGLPAGTYRLCSMNTDANHVPCLVAVAQHGSLDDCIYVSGNNSIYFEFRLIFACSSLSVVAPTMFSRPELPAMPLVLLAMPQAQELQVPAMPLVLLTIPQQLLVPAMPHRLPQPVQVLPRLAKVQVQEKVQAQTRVVMGRTAVAKQAVVACVWVTTSGVTIELRDSREAVGHGMICYFATSFS